MNFATSVFVLSPMLLLLLPLAAVAGSGTSPAKSVHDFTMKNIEGKDIPLSVYEGKVMLIVNVASKCGYTAQYKDLEALYRKYKDRGLVILGFPANNFLWQEPGSDEDILRFCRTTYDVTFDMFSKISVRGSDQHPLYAFITSKKTNPEFAGDVKWNFQKYLIDKHGNIIGKYLSGVKPLSDELVGDIEKALGEK